MTNARDRNQVRQTRAATPKARLPSLPPVPQSDPAMAVFLNAVKERLEVREGSRGNPFEAVVTQRDLKDLGLTNSQVVLTPTGAVGGIVVQMPGGNYATLSVDAFAEGIRQSKLFQDLQRRLDDPARFDSYPDEVKRILSNSIAEEAANRGADIRRMEQKIQSVSDSLAIRTEEITASVEGAAAGVRETAFAAANDARAVAGQVTQVEARLDDVGGVTVEQAITAVADRATGLEGQYTLKIQAGNKVAGFGLAASSPVSGAATSAFIVQADKFAIVATTDAITDPANPPLTRIPFGVDASGVYINGQVRINASGATLDSTAKRIQLTAPTTVFKVNASGVSTPTSITITATLLNGLTGTINWTVTNGTVANFPKTGATAAVPYADVSTAQATIRATVIESGVTYTADFTVYKALDGAAGSPGSPGADGDDGARGSITGYGTPYALYLSGTSDDTDPWPSTSTNAYRANRVINNLLTGAVLTTNLTTTGHLRIGDTVTLTNSGATTAQTRYWSGAAWVKPGVVINGNLLVSGTISGDKIIANTIAVGKLSSIGTAETVGTSRTFGLNITEPSTGWLSAVYGRSATGVSPGVLGVSAATSGTVPVGTVGIGTTTASFGGGFYNYVSSTQVSKAVFGGYDYAGVCSFGLNKNVFICNSNYALESLLNQGRFRAADGFLQFTGVHDAATQDDPQLGDIMVDGAMIVRHSVSSAVACAELSGEANQRGAIGVCAEVCAEPPSPWKPEPVDASEVAAGTIPLPDGYKVIFVNGAGEGMVNVCAENGDIEKGDLIVTSSIPGKGMKQADDIVRSCTVAKAREAVTFASPGEVKMIACIYLCG